VLDNIQEAFVKFCFVLEKKIAAGAKIHQTEEDGKTDNDYKDQDTGKDRTPNTHSIDNGGDSVDRDKDADKDTEEDRGDDCNAQLRFQDEKGLLFHFGSNAIVTFKCFLFFRISSRNI